MRYFSKNSWFVLLPLLECEVTGSGSMQLLLGPIKGDSPRMKKVWVDQGYTGKGREWIEQEMSSGANVCLDWEASTDEQRLRVPDKQQREHDLSGDDQDS